MMIIIILLFYFLIALLSAHSSRLMSRRCGSRPCQWLNDSLKIQQPRIRYPPKCHTSDSAISLVAVWLVPRGTADVSAQDGSAVCTIQPMHQFTVNVSSFTPQSPHRSGAYNLPAVTCHLVNFWENDWDLLRTTAVTREWNGYRNTELGLSQHQSGSPSWWRLKILLLRFEPAGTSRVRHSTGGSELLISVEDGVTVTLSVRGQS